MFFVSFCGRVGCSGEIVAEAGCQGRRQVIRQAGSGQGIQADQRAVAVTLSSVSFPLVCHTLGNTAVMSGHVSVI